MREFLSIIGRSLLLPLAVLPVAVALILLGPTAGSGLTLIEAGALLLQLMPLFFAISLALGRGRSGAGATILAVIIAYALVMFASQGVLLGIDLLSGSALISQQWQVYAFIAGLFFFCYLLIFLIVRTLGLGWRGRSSKQYSHSTALQTAESAGALVYALGGVDNIVNVDNCATRLLLTVRDSALVDTAHLRKLGVNTVVVPSDTAVQVTTGRQTEFIAAAMRDHLPAANGSAAANGSGVPAGQKVEAGSNGSAQYDPAVSASVLLMIKALGGARNIVDAGEIATTRLRVVVRDESLINEEALRASGASGVMLLGSTLHILLGMRAGLFAQEMQLRLDELQATS